MGARLSEEEFARMLKGTIHEGKYERDSDPVKEDPSPPQGSSPQEQHQLTTDMTELAVFAFIGRVLAKAILLPFIIFNWFLSTFLS